MTHIYGKTLSEDQHRQALAYREQFSRFAAELFLLNLLKASRLRMSRWFGQASPIW